MLEKLIFEKDATIGQESLKVKLVASKSLMDDDESYGKLIYTVEGGIDRLTLEFVLNEESKTLSIINFPSITVTNFCLLSCAISLAGPVLDCWKQTKDRDQLLACLEKNSATLSMGATACIMNCQGSL